jgi:hypothetical protein
MAPENAVMVYSPRDEQEVNVIFALLHASRLSLCGWSLA